MTTNTYTSCSSQIPLLNPMECKWQKRFVPLAILHSPILPDNYACQTLQWKKIQWHTQQSRAGPY